MADKREGIPDEEQLLFLMRRYSSIRLQPIDNGQESMSVSTATAEFKQPIFAVDCGNAERRIALALQYQAAFEQADLTIPSRIMVDGNLDLVQTTFNLHKKLSGDDPYNPKQPFDHQLMLMEGDNIPEYELFNNGDDS